MSVHVLIRHPVKEYKEWKETFDAARDHRKAGGEQSCRVFQNMEDEHDVMLLFKWESIEKAESYFTSAELLKRMAAGGVSSQPEFNFLEEKTG